MLQAQSQSAKVSPHGGMDEVAEKILMRQDNRAVKEEKRPNPYGICASRFIFHSNPHHFGIAGSLRLWRSSA